jgi:F-type H+-transporting ATPase subunit delta
VIDETIARRYAKALIDIGKDDGNYEKYGVEIATFSNLIKENRDMEIFLINPVFETNKRLEVTSGLLEKLEFSPIAGNFIRLLVQKKRIEYLDEIIDEYQKQVDILSNVVRAKIYSATELSQEEIDEICGRLENITKKDVKISVDIDPSLIGGIVAQVGDEIIDGSLRTNLLQIKQNLVKE